MTKNSLYGLILKITKLSIKDVPLLVNNADTLPSVNINVFSAYSTKIELSNLIATEYSFSSIAIKVEI